MAFVTVYLHACTIFISLTCSSSNYRYREEHVSCTCETIAARYRHMWEAIYFYNAERYESSHCYPLLYLQSKSVLPL
jgi:hypothetical protein